MTWADTVDQLDLTGAQKVAAKTLELQTHQPPAIVFKVDEQDRCLITPKFLLALTQALHKHFGGLVYVMVGHDGEPGRVVH